MTEQQVEFVRNWCDNNLELELMSATVIKDIYKAYLQACLIHDAALPLHPKTFASQLRKHCRAGQNASKILFYYQNKSKGREAASMVRGLRLENPRINGALLKKSRGLLNAVKLGDGAQWKH